ncbi:MAG: HD domain-containing protein [Anaerolineae bacterium]|nr:HD domain-containing protein [Anaerolineae bacterium]
MTQSSYLGYTYPRLAQVIELAKTCHYAAGHAEQVTRLSILLFHELADVHFLPEKYLEWLIYAGILHDIGWLDGWRGHHKASQNIILRTTLLPFTTNERMVISNIARYHRGALPKSGHELYTTLSSEDRAVVNVLGGMLRLADGLDASHRSVVDDLLASTIPGKTTLTIHCRSTPTEEVQAAKRKKDLLMAALNTEITIQWQQAPRPTRTFPIH